MQHEPIGNVNGNRKQAEFSNGYDIDKVPDEGEGKDVGEGGVQDFHSAPT